MSGPLVGFLSATISLSTPILLVALGEIIAERSGVFNLGVEGIMLAGALVGVVATGVTGSPWLGFFAAMAAGVAIAFVHGVLCITLKSNQIISGLMLSILMAGLTTFVGVSIDIPSIEGFSTLSVPVVGGWLLAVPIVGEVVLGSYPTDVLAVLGVPAVWYLLFRTDLGLEIIAVGDDPGAADTMGIPVRNIRYLCVLTGGAFAGAGGAALSIATVNFWASGLTAGRGWVAIGLVIFAAWRPTYALFGALLFGAIDAMRVRAELVRGLIEGLQLDPGVADLLLALTNPSLMASYPYLVTIVVLLAISYRGSTAAELGAPQALLEPYLRESE